MTRQNEEANSGRKRPVNVTDENQPPGDPGPDVDIQEHVGGQPGRADPGETGGPSHEQIGAHERGGEPEVEPEAGNALHRRMGEEEDERKQPEAHRHGGVPDPKGDTDIEQQLREKTGRPFPDRGDHE